MVWPCPVTVENDRFIWVSHCGRLIRGSPEQLRPASLREYSRLSRDSHGRVADTPDGNGPRDTALSLEGMPRSDVTRCWNHRAKRHKQFQQRSVTSGYRFGSEYTPREPNRWTQPDNWNRWEMMFLPMASEVPIPCETNDALFVFGDEF